MSEQKFAISLRLYYSGRFDSIGEICEYATAGEYFAKVFKYGNIEHFEKLKAEGKFCN